MTYYELQPECSGTLGEETTFEGGGRSGKVTSLAFEFDSWPDDCINEAVGNFIVSEKLKNAFQNISPPLTGCDFADVKITTDSQFDEMNPGRELPKYLWLKVTGIAGQEDFGTSKSYGLVVSNRVLEVLRTFPSANLEAVEFND